MEGDGYRTSFSSWLQGVRTAGHAIQKISQFGDFKYMNMLFLVLCRVKTYLCPVCAQVSREGKELQSSRGKSQPADL